MYWIRTVGIKFDVMRVIYKMMVTVSVDGDTPMTTPAAPVNSTVVVTANPAISDTSPTSEHSTPTSTATLMTHTSSETTSSPVASSSESISTTVVTTNPIKGQSTQLTTISETSSENLVHQGTII